MTDFNNDALERLRREQPREETAMNTDTIRARAFATEGRFRRQDLAGDAACLRSRGDQEGPIA